jgi:uncharacterized delta-60 repeat protein
VTAEPAFAAPGDLDPTFGNSGLVTTSFDTGVYSEIDGLALQSDGKIVAVGLSYDGTNGQFALARYDPDGTLDPTFGSGGMVTTDFGSGVDEAYAVVIRNNGKVVVAGQAWNGHDYDFALARYYPDGALDASFNGTGKVLTDFLANDEAFDLTLQGNGQVVVAGSASSKGKGYFALARYLADGSLDPTFSRDGKLLTEFQVGSNGASAVATQSDDKIVAAGAAWDGSGSDFGIVRYNADGTRDASFGNDGKVMTDFGDPGDWATDLALQPDGKIVAVGNAHEGVNDEFALARYTADGHLDPTFSGDGKKTTSFGIGDDSASAVLIQQDGKIIATGTTVGRGKHGLFALVRYKPNGAPDKSFGREGKVTTDFGFGGDYALDAVLQPDGKVVAGGLASNESTYDFGLARYLG